MDIEKLTKNQIVLLTLLISFVTSIATGIVTVSLMEQAPPAITQTVNHIVERTVEKVVPQSLQPASVAAAATIQEKTVVIKESDLIAEALEHVRPSIVRIYSSESENPMFLGIGVVIDRSGIIVTDTNAMGELADAVIVSGDSKVRAFVTRRDTDASVAYLQGATTTIDGNSAVWLPAGLSAKKIALGETVFMITGKTVQRVDNGIVTALIPGESETVVLDTNIASGPIMFGSPLVDTNGEIVGVSTGFSRLSSASGFVPASRISAVPPGGTQ